MNSNQLDDLRRKPVIIWQNYGLDGWQPYGYDSADAAVEAVLNGERIGPLIVTYPYLLDLVKQVRR